MKLNLLLLSVAALVNAATAVEPIAEVEAVDLKTAGTYVILAKSGISTVPASEIIGNIAVSPITVAAITGFGLILDSSGTFSTATQVTGNVYGPDYTSPTPSELTTAIGDMETAYTDAAGRPNTDSANINLGGGAIGGMTLTTGVYTFGVDITIGPATKVYFNGTADDVFIIRTTGSVVQAANTMVILQGGVLAKNIFWQVAGEVIVGAGAHLEGVLLVKTAAVFNTGASLNGRILAQTACTLQMAVIKEPPASNL
jgi:hypothetical protein